MSFRNVFGGRAHFSASLSLLIFVRNVSLMNPSLDPYFSGEGVQSMDDSAGHGQGVHPLGW